MKIRVLSDLHLEFDRPASIPHVDADLVVLAGDIHNGGRGIAWAAQTFAGPVVYVAGNHEYYDGSLPAVRAELRAAAQATRGKVHLLDPGELVLGEHATRVLGATLWTDFTLYGSSERDLQTSVFACQRVMTDFHGPIRVPEGAGARRFAPRDHLALHQADRAWLGEKLAQPFAGRTVVVTHHAPHPGSLAARFALDRVSAGFVTDLSDLLAAGVTLWVHGHTHDPFDYRVAGARVVCQPRGYVDSARGVAENPAFDWNYVVEL